MSKGNYKFYFQTNVSLFVPILQIILLMYSLAVDSVILLDVTEHRLVSTATQKGMRYVESAMDSLLIRVVNKVVEGS